jgi:ubiquitin
MLIQPGTRAATSLGGIAAPRKSRTTLYDILCRGLVCSEHSTLLRAGTTSMLPSPTKPDLNQSPRQVSAYRGSVRVYVINHVDLDCPLRSQLSRVSIEHLDFEGGGFSNLPLVSVSPAPIVSTPSDVDARDGRAEEETSEEVCRSVNERYSTAVCCLVTAPQLSCPGQYAH